MAISTTPQGNTYSWSDPATGAPTPAGVGTPTLVSSGSSSSSSGSSSSSSGGSSSSSGTSASQVNQLYQQYFGRNATTAETNFWTTQPVSSLQIQLQTDYKNASGISYDGSPIVPRTTQTQNQIAEQSKEEMPTNVEDQNEDIPTNNSDKNIYKRGADLYIKSGNVFYKIPDQKSLEDLVFNKGYKDTRTALPSDAEIGSVSSTQVGTTETQETTETTDKNIYKRGNDLYIKKDNKYYKIPDPTTLYNLITRDGYNDSRIELPEGAIISGYSTTEEPINAYDPFEEAGKYGYTREDFANDPGFEAYWKTKTPEQLVAELKKRKDFDTASNMKKDLETYIDPETGTQLDITAEQKAELKKLNDDIDAMDLSIEQKAVLKQIAAMDFMGGKIPNKQELEKIIETATLNTETDLAPYYEKVTGRELEDLKNQMQDIRTSVSNYVASESASYKNKLAETKQNLRTRGLTFSGMNRQQLGAEGALKSEGVEGIIPEERRLDYTGKMSEISSQARDLGLAAERKLGSSAMPGLGSVTTPYGTSQLYNPKALGQEGYIKTGDIELDKIKEKEKGIWDRISKYRSNI